MKLPLEIYPKAYPRTGSFSWKSSWPFVENRCGILLHRPRYIRTFTHFGYPYLAIKFWCGNTHVGSDKFTFHEKLTERSGLLCARCEEMAVLAGLPSADNLSEGHVHLGKLRAIKVCCDEKEKP